MPRDRVGDVARRGAHHRWRCCDGDPAERAQDHSAEVRPRSLPCGAMESDRAPGERAPGYSKRRQSGLPGGLKSDTWYPVRRIATIFARGEAMPSEESRTACHAAIGEQSKGE